MKKVKIKEVNDMKGNPIIRQIVGRCHVSESYCNVYRYMITRLSNGYRTYVELPKATRRGMWREMVRVHAENRGLYCWVMGGVK